MKTPRAGHIQRLKLVGAGAFGAVALIALVGALSFGGGAVPQPFEDPGALVRWGLPTSKLAFNLCAAVTIGAFVFAAFVLPPSSASYALSRKIALVAASSWTIVSFAGLSFNFLSLVPMNAFDPGFLQQFGYFAEVIPLGQVWLITTLLAAALTLIAYVSDRPAHAAMGSAVAVLVVLPVALTGHGEGDQGHGAAVTALALHMVGAALWLGGLLVLTFVRTTRDRGPVKLIVQRYSALALTGFIVVTVSGAVSATIQLGNFANLASPYGLIVLAKVAILVLLGLAGAWNRSRLISRLDTPGRAAAKAFWLIVSAELLLLGVVSGLAVGLGRTSPPEQAAAATFPSLAQAMTGNPTPPEPSLLTFFTEWRFDPLWAMVCAAGLVFYLLGVRRLRGRGRSWPHSRTLAWVAGLFVVFYATNGSIAVYQEYLLGFNVASLALICLGAPVALVVARPATLALLVIEPRADQSIGGVEIAGWITRATAVRGMRSPIVWATIMLISIAAFYFTPWVVSSVRDPFGYHLTVVWFGLVGVMLVRSLLLPHAVAPAIVALGVLLLGLIGVALALQIHPATPGAEWFRDLQLEWRGDPRAGSFAIVGFAAVWASACTAAVLYRHPQVAPAPEVPQEILINEGTK